MSIQGQQRYLDEKIEAFSQENQEKDEFIRELAAKLEEKEA